MFQVEHLFLQLAQDRCHARFGGFQRGRQLLILGPGFVQLAPAVRGVGFIGELGDLLFPLGEEIVGDLVHLLDAFSHRLGARLRRFVFALKFVVVGLQRPTIHRVHFPKTGQRVLKLGGRLILRIPGLLNRGLEQVAFLDTKLLHRGVVHRLTASDSEQ